MEPPLYSRARIEAFTDAIFGVSMTLLVLDVRLPEDFRPGDSAEMIQGIVALWPKFFPYALSFLVLGLRWLSFVRLSPTEESYGPQYTKYWLIFLFLVTCVPFTTIAVGRYASLAPAIWLYAGNTALIGLASLALLHHTPGMDQKNADWRGRRISLVILVCSALIATGWSFISPHQALWAFALNVFSPLLARLRGAA
jgi:uncharacterized membrane protein